MFNGVQVFYMTGTGNSQAVGEWLGETARGLGLAVGQQRLDVRHPLTVDSGQQLCVFVLPTHGFTAPWLMLKTIWRLPPGQGQGAAVLATRAGLRIQGVVLPGMEGTAGYLPALLLVWRGYRVIGVNGIDMPSNWTALHWGLSPANSVFIAAAARCKVQHFARTVLRGEKYFDSIVPLLLGICLLPVSILYLLLAQLILAKLFFATAACTGCGLCWRSCPKQAIVPEGQGRRPYWTFACDSCMACMNHCPQQAIETSPLLILLAYYLTVVPLAAYALPAAWPGGEGGLWAGAADVLQYVWLIAVMALAHRLLHSVQGWRWLSRILAALSHTHYYRRYRAPKLPEKGENPPPVSKQ